MGRKYSERSLQILDLMNSHEMGDPFVVDLGIDEREDVGYRNFRQRIRNCADRLDPPRRVSINRNGTRKATIVLMGVK